MDTITFARSYKLKPTKRQEKIINECLMAISDLYNSALKELESELIKSSKIPKPGDFKKHYAAHRNNSNSLQLVPSTACQSVYDKLIISYKMVLDRERAKIAGEFYKNNIPKDISEEDAKKLKDSLKSELNQYILVENLKKFKPKTNDNVYSTIPYFMDQYEYSLNDEGQFIGFKPIHGVIKYKNQPELILGFLRVFSDGKPFYGKIKRIEIVKKTDGLYLCLSIEAEKNKIPARTKPDANSSTGIDFGTKKCCILSDGNKHDKFTSTQKKRLKVLWNKKNEIQKILSNIEDTYRKMNSLDSGRPNSNRYNKYLAKLRNVELDIVRIREFAGHSLSNKVLDNYQNVYVEDIQTSNLMQKDSLLSKKTQSSMKRNISHNSWGEIKNQLVYKANWRGNNVVLVPAKNTTQTCSNCGNIKTGDEKLKLSDRVYNCDKCGMSMDRDINAAMNIQSIGEKI
jgi:IS605 OrfB family transposase